MKQLCWVLIAVNALAAAQGTPGLVWAHQLARSEAAGLKLTVGDVAQIDGVDESVVRTIRGIELIDLPANGRLMMISRDTIVQAVRASERASSANHLEWDGAATTQVTLKTVSLTGEQVAALGRRFIGEALGADAVSARFGETAMPEAFECVAGRWATRVTVRSHDPGMICGLVRLEIVALTDGVERRAMPFVIEVNRKGRILVAAHDLQTGQALRADDVVFSQQDLSTIGADALDQPEKLVGTVLTRRVAAGQPLTARDVRARPFVERDDIVTLRFKSGALQVTGLGRVQAPGAPGERVPVVNLGSNKLVHAVVIDSRTLEVASPGAAERKP